MVEVSQESDFGTAVGGVITLDANTTYFVRGIVNCTNRLLISNDGTAIKGWNRDEDGLSYTGATGAGDFITVKDLLDEVSKDSIRFMMLNRSHDVELDFDFTKVKEKSNHPLPKEPPTAGQKGIVRRASRLRLRAAAAPRPAATRPRPRSPLVR